MKGQILSLEVAYLVHATEDPAKIGDAVSRFLSRQTAPEVERLEGHFGNPILKARVHLTGEEASEALAKALAKIPRPLRASVVADLPLFMDEHSALFLRLDKQSMVFGPLRLGGSDPVRIKVKPRLFQLKGPASRLYRELLGAP